MLQLRVACAYQDRFRRGRAAMLTGQLWPSSCDLDTHLRLTHALRDAAALCFPKQAQLKKPWKFDGAWELYKVREIARKGLASKNADLGCRLSLLLGVATLASAKVSLAP